MVVSSKRITVRLLNDGPMRWPLWFENPIADDVDQQPISEQLKAALRDWTQFYHEHYDDSWDIEENAVRYNRIGLALAGKVASELGPGFRVLLQVQQTSCEQQRWVVIAEGD